MLGKGAAGIVYKAQQQGVSRVVALKVLQAMAERDVQRFQRECQTLSKLDHPSIVHVFAWGITAQGAPYLVLEYVEGRSLQSALKDGPLPVDECIAMAAQLCDALSYAHKLEIIHRDIKPGNILLTAECAKLLDFGLAKVAGQDLRITKTEAIVGTPVYMAPEQFMSASASAASDVYSLACTLYEALCGKEAFGGDSAFEIFNSHANGQYVQLPESVPPHVRSAIDIALRSDAASRFASAEDFKKALLGQQPLVAPLAVPKRVASNVVRRPDSSRIVIAVAAILMLLAVGTTVYSMLSVEPDLIKQAIEIEKNDPAAALDKANEAIRVYTDKYGQDSDKVAEAMFYRVRLDRGKTWKEVHERIALQANGYKNQSRWNDLIHLYSSEVDLARQVFGPDDPMAAVITASLAEYMLHADRVKDAQHAAEMSWSYFNKRHPLTAQQLDARSRAARCIAGIAARSGDYTRAESFLEKAIHDYILYRGAMQHNTIDEPVSEGITQLSRMRYDLAQLYFKQEQYESVVATLKPTIVNGDIGRMGALRIDYEDLYRRALEKARQ